MDKKAVFFDIDGTLWHRDKPIPESVGVAIKELRANGHYAFINTGRSLAHVTDKALLDLGWDGIVSGCGTHVMIGDKVIHSKIFPACEWEDIIKLTRSYNIRMISEGVRYLYFDDEDYADDPYGQMLIKELGPERRTIKDEWGKWEAGKFSVDLDPDTPAEGWIKDLCTKFGFIFHNDIVVEVVPIGHDKSTGMGLACRHLDISLANAVAFGDSFNDVGMMNLAGESVAMGSALDSVKAEATYVTGTVEEDGIYNGLTHLGLI